MSASKACSVGPSKCHVVGVPSQYAKVGGSIPGQGTHKKQPMKTYISGKTN